MKTMRCQKCGEVITISPSYEKEMVGFHEIENLRYTCPNCGYSWTTPTVDSKKNND